MRALELKDFHQLVVVDRDEPTVGPGDVLIDVVATGICGSDIHGYTGENGRRVPGQVMGHETVGRIAALGAGDRCLRPGRRPARHVQPTHQLQRL
jgi:threonine dehydrogenase-like Zn-dependent dehydrogenase